MLPGFFLEETASATLSQREKKQTFVEPALKRGRGTDTWKMTSASLQPTGKDVISKAQMSNFETFLRQPVQAPHHTETISTNGYTIIPDLFHEEEIESLVRFIEAATTRNANFRKDVDLFAIRNFIGELPGIRPLLFIPRFNELIDTLFGKDYFLVKAIYFNKPEHANWLVPWHQDMTISVDRKGAIEGFGPWTLKHGSHAVQPATEILEHIFTVRLHLDDCDETNGALKIIPGTHRLGKMDAEKIRACTRTPVICNVKKGGIMIMKPLLLHASGKRTSNRNRRVIHLEFASQTLPGGLKWQEYADRYGVTSERI